MVSQRRIRDATAQDVRTIHALVCELAGTVGDSPPRFENVRRRFAELLEEPRARVLVAEGEDSVVVGVVSLWIKPDLAHGDTVVEVPMLVVTEGLRRAGVGKALMEEVQRLAAENEVVVTATGMATRFGRIADRRLRGSATLDRRIGRARRRGRRAR